MKYSLVPSLLFCIASAGAYAQSLPAPGEKRDMAAIMKQVEIRIADDEIKRGVGKQANSRFAVASTKHADERIQTVTYDPNQVVKIYTAVNNPTLIQFEEDESVLDPSKGMLGAGDAKAWSMGPKGSNVMLKPAGTKPDTKLLIVTNKRTYAFEIKSVTKKSGIEPTLILRFDYPDSRAKAELEASNKRDLVSQRLGKISGGPNGTLTRNSNYMKQGDEALAPREVYDDGRFTFMVFDSSRELPVVYKILPDGEEALTNSHMDSETGTIVVHETCAKFILRYGNSVMAIRNDSFNPHGKLNVLGTTVPNALRIKKDEL